MYDPELEAIFDDFNSNFIRDKEFLISFYERNEAKLSSVIWLDHDSLLKYESISGWYLWALVHKKKYNHVINEAPAILSKIETNQNNLNIDPATDKYYHFIIKQRAFAKYFRLMLYSAKKDFLTLNKYDSEDKSYARWARVSEYYSLALILYAVSALIVFGDGFYKSRVPVPVNILLLIIGLICCIVAWLIDINARRFWKNSQGELKVI